MAPTQLQEDTARARWKNRLRAVVDHLIVAALVGLFSAIAGFFIARAGWSSLETHSVDLLRLLPGRPLGFENMETAITLIILVSGLPFLWEVYRRLPARGSKASMSRAFLYMIMPPIAVAMVVFSGVIITAGVSILAGYAGTGR